MLLLLHVFSRNGEFRVFERLLRELDKVCTVEYLGLHNTVWGGYSTRDYATLPCILKDSDADILNINGLDKQGFTYNNITQSNKMKTALAQGYYTDRYIPQRIDHYRSSKSRTFTPIIPQLLMRKQDVPPDMASFLVANHDKSLEMSRKERETLDKLFHGAMKHLY